MSVERSAAPAYLDPLAAPEDLNQILQVGNDGDLLSYRAQVLRWAGWPVVSRRSGGSDPQSAPAAQPSATLIASTSR